MADYPNSQLTAVGGKPISAGGSGTEFTFSADPDTGMIRTGVNQLSFETAGIRRWAIDANGRLTAEGDFPIQTGDGTANLPSYTFATDTDTGMYHKAANTIGFATNATERCSMTAGALTYEADVPVTAIFGRTRLAETDGADNATFSHFDMSAVGTFALKQSAAGLTTINCQSAQSIRFEVGGSGKWQVTASTFAFSPLVDNSFDVGATALRVRRKYLAEYMEISEMTAPAAPGADKARLFCQDNGAGKTQLMVIFSSGAAQQIAIQP